MRNHSYDFKLLQATIISIIVLKVLGNGQSTIQCETSTTTPNVKRTCLELGFNVIGNTCINNQSIVVGLDLHDCNITELNGTFVNSTELIVLGLTNNPLTNCTVEEFDGLGKLEYLFLPDSCSCPGDNWDIMIKNGSTVICEEQTTCNNVSCSDNGQCISKGPGQPSCICKDGYYGYRCLRKGQFPLTAFLVGLIIPTVIITVLVWYTQRRNIKKD